MSDMPERIARRAEAIERATGVDFDTAAQLAGNAIRSEQELGGYEPGMVYLPLSLATAAMNTCPVCFFDADGVTPCPEHLAQLCEGCYRALNGKPGPCAECAREAW